MTSSSAVHPQQLNHRATALRLRRFETFLCVSQRMCQFTVSTCLDNDGVSYPCGFKGLSWSVQSLFECPSLRLLLASKTVPPRSLSPSRISVRRLVPLPPALFAFRLHIVPASFRVVCIRRCREIILHDLGRLFLQVRVCEYTVVASPAVQAKERMPSPVPRRRHPSSHVLYRDTRHTRRVAKRRRGSPPVGTPPHFARWGGG